MEPIHKTSKFEQEDFISNMPDLVQTNIMDRLPVKDAVRTGILSRNWRYKCTILSQLILDENFFECFKHTKDKTDIGRIVSRLLLVIKDGITKFVLSIDEEACSSATVEEDISYWILFLSRIGIKDLTIEKRNGKPLKLPTHLFSCLELKHLKLVYCCFDPPASFQGFPNLLSLELCHVKLESGKFVKFFTNRCPTLEILTLSYPLSYPSEVLRWGFVDCIGKVKLAEIGKLANLKELSLAWRMLDNLRNIFAFMRFLPKLLKLSLSFIKCKFIEGTAKRCLPKNFPHCLETLKLSEIDISNGIGLSFALIMISIFPNLQTFEIASCYRDATTPTPEICSPEMDTMGRLLQLRSVVFTDMKGSEKEVCFIKYLLACSPLLKKIFIRLNCCLSSDEKFTLAKKLLKLHRASPVVDINLS